MDGRLPPTHVPTGMSSAPYRPYANDLHLQTHAYNHSAFAAPLAMTTPPYSMPSYPNPYYSAPLSSSSSNLTHTFGRGHQLPPQDMAFSNPYSLGHTSKYYFNSQQVDPSLGTHATQGMSQTPPGSFVTHQPSAFTGSGGFNSDVQHGDTFGRPAAAWNVLQHFEGLFGKVDPRYITIAGTADAVAQLQNAIAVERLMVESHQRGCHDAFIASLKYLQARGAIADNTMEDTGKGRFALDEMSGYERAAFDVSDADFLVDPANSVQNLSDPPFQGNVDFLLGLLRVLKKYHAYWEGTSFRLGIVTKRETGDYQVQIIKAQEEEDDLTDTVWLYRECVGDFKVQGGWTELWHAFVLRPGAPHPTKQIFQPRERKSFNGSEESYGNPSTAASSPLKRKQPQNTTSQGQSRNAASQVPMAAPPMAAAPPTNTAPMMAPAQAIPHGIPARLSRSGAQIKQDKAHLFQHLTDEEILSGSVHPEDICGSLMLRLVPNHSNTEIHACLNKLFERLNPVKPKKLTAASAITKRWTLSLKHFCKRDGFDFKAEKKRYKALRKQNGIAGGNHDEDDDEVDENEDEHDDEDEYEDDSPEQTSKKRKFTNVKAEDENASSKNSKASKVKTEKKGSIIKREDSFDFIAPPTEALTRGKRARKQVNYAALVEGFDDGEDDELDDSDENEGPPTKRIKKYDDDDEEGSEFEQDEDGGW